MKNDRPCLVRLAFAASAVCCASAVCAAPLLSAPGVTGIRIFEDTIGVTPFDFLVTDPRLTTQVVGALSAVNADFPGLVTTGTTEVYDVFVSNAAGALDPAGAFLTIEGICTGASSGCFNISEVALLSGAGILEFGNSVSNVVFGSSGGVAGSELLAIDANTATTTILGNTNGQPVGDRMRLTIGFAALPPAAAPEPGTLAMLLTSLASLIGIRSRRRRVRS